MRELITLNQAVLIKCASVIALYFLSMYISKKVFDIIIKKNNNIQIKFIQSAVRVVVTVLFMFAFGMLFETTRELSKAFLQSSALFVAVAGFAAQQVLADVISGMMLSWSKPFNIGERITLKNSNITGLVEDITVRHTVIKTFHNSRLIIPNSIINKEILENSNFTSDYIGNYLEISVGYKSDLNKAIEIMQRIVSENDKVIDIREDKTVGEKVSVLVKELGASGIILKTTVWTKDTNDNFNACSEIRVKIKEEFDKAGIEIPYNKLSIALEGSKENE